MAPEVTQQLAYILWVLLASGSWAQEIKLLQTLEGETISVRCQYRPYQQSLLKSWCRHTSIYFCTIIVDSFHREAPALRSSIEIFPQSHYFIVTMTGLRVTDSGIYSCQVSDNSLRSFTILQTIRLMVAKAPANTSRTRMTTVPASATSPVFESPPPSNWKILVAAVVVTGLLLLGLALLVALYLRKRRRRARKGENEFHHVYDDIPVRKEEPPGSDGRIVSDEDTGSLCYASLIHSNPLGFPESVYANTHPAQKPMPDPVLFVEYTSIARSRPQRPLSAAPEEASRNQRQNSRDSEQLPNAH
ncbi:CMRF35-like molecule 7 [Dipodomys spectabilis]|uniref:CMRF35-like molecule 7 n=1 Tax=Dipodomys spectabilis TaxID=105255 RepID=UPI001C54735E|nr:CMRF35-like molecule 7 [Dipodomys spectabilis]